MMLLLSATQGMAQRKNLIDRTLDWSYKIVQGDSAHPRKHYFFPVPILAYKPETRWIYGLSLTQLFHSKHNDSLTRPSAIRLNTSYSQNNQFSIRAMGEIFTDKNKFDINGLIQYTDFVENYYGIGINRPDSAQLYYFRLVKIALKGTYLIRKGLYAGVQYNLENMYDIRPENNGTVFLDDQSKKVPGTAPAGSVSSGMGFSLEYDNRDNIFFPKKGYDIELSNCFYTTAFGSQYTFHNITLDARKFIDLWKENVLAIQAFANINWNPVNGSIPFRMLGTLGSDTYMRGYYNGRYRDNNAMAFQTELRKTIWGPLAMVVFAGFGTVSKTPDGLTTNLKANYGGGLRVMAIPKEKMNIRLDYGMGVDGIAAFYLTMGEAF
jgi:outer membrane protein assembly factor BamA